MRILDASILFTKANNVRAQLDYISADDRTTGEDLLHYNNLIRVIDKIFMSDNTREHRLDLENFVLFNGDEIYRKYIHLNYSSLANDSSDDRDKYDIGL